jgi:hypothetical protein
MFLDAEVAELHSTMSVWKIARVAAKNSIAGSMRGGVRRRGAKKTVRRNAAKETV